jgi:DeoR family fructose operon transcriptional repressor
MLLAKRLEEITKILERDKSVDVNTLSEKLGVTGKTIRQDLDKLEEMDLIERVHGGAILKRGSNSIFPIIERKQTNLEEKKSIAEIASSYIEEGDIIYLDSGTTTLPIAELLGDKRITVVTNDPFIVHELLYKDNITLYVIGGKLRREEGAYTLVGHTAIKDISLYNIQKYFLATSAIDLKQGLMIFSSEEAEIKKAVIGVSKQVICVCDYTKFHKMAIFTICSIDDIDVLISDNRIPEEDRLEITRKGIELRVA